MTSKYTVLVTYKCSLIFSKSFDDSSKARELHTLLHNGKTSEVEVSTSTQPEIVEMARKLTEAKEEKNPIVV